MPSDDRPDLAQTAQNRRDTIYYSTLIVTSPFLQSVVTPRSEILNDAVDSISRPDFIL